MLRNLLARLLAPINRWALAQLRKEHQVLGFRVVLDNTRMDIDSTSVLRRFTESLELIARTQPSRFRRMQQDVALFWIARQPVRGAYYPGCGMVMTELTFLARTDIGPEVVASSMLHEGIHARIDRMRLRPESRSYGREERVCRKAELAFARALPSEQGAHLIAYIESMLALSDEELDLKIDWKEAHRRQAELDRAAFKSWIRGAT